MFRYSIDPGRDENWLTVLYNNLVVLHVPYDNYSLDEIHSLAQEALNRY